MRSASRANDFMLPAETQRWVAAALARRPRGFLTDIDGTLSAIVPTPDQARLYRGVRPLLRRCLAEFDVVAAISGRPAVDARRLVGIPQMVYVGNHGMEALAPGDRQPTIAPEARVYQSAIDETLRDARGQLIERFPALLFENKGVTASVHYRQAPDPEAAHDAIRRTLDPLASAHGLRLTEGRMVVELRPPVERDKGTSVRALVRRRALASALYLGDDRTDEDAFRALRELRAEGVCEGIAVAIGHAEAPASLVESADIVLPSIAQVPGFIAWILGALDALHSSQSLPS
ncbi:MAG TPA: trehalose-phosphatase [Ktedonobacterales bacterium]